MGISNKKRVIIFLILIASFLVVSTLLLCSVNLFSLSKKDVEIGNIDLLSKINTTSLTEHLSNSDKLKLIDYFVEYQNLKSNIKNLSKDKLNRLLNLTGILSKYFGKEDLGMSKELVNQALERYEELSNTIDDDGTKDINEIIKNLKVNKSLLNNVADMRDSALQLYKQNNISKATYSAILEQLSDIEYKINLSDLEKKDIGAFTDIDKTLASMQKELDAINYVTEFINETGSSGVITPSLEIDKYSKIVNLIDGVDMDALSNVLDFIDSGDNDVTDSSPKDSSYPVDFSKSITFPKIEVEGNLKDAWDLNVDASSLCLDNLLGQVDIALISEDSLDNIMSSITTVKLPNIDEILKPTALPSIVPTETIVPTITPSVVPTETTVPTITPSILRPDSPTMTRGQ